MEDRIQKRERGWTHHRKNELIKAEKIYLELIEERAQEEDIANLGALLRSQGRIKEAMKLYKTWWGRVEITPNICLNAVNAAIEINSLKEANKWLIETSEIYSNDIRLTEAKARLYQAMEKKVEAIELLKELTSQKDAKANTWIELGRAYNSNGEIDEALVSFRTAKEINNKDPRPTANIITILSEKGRFKEANKEVEKTECNLKEELAIKGAIAYLKLKEEKIYEAAIDYAELCRIDPLQPIYWLNWCACKRKLKRNIEALQISKKGLSINPSNDNLRHAMSQCLAETGNPELAIKVMREEIEGEKKISEQNLYNLQFIGEGYQIIDSEKLKCMAEDWESIKIKKRIGPLWGDRIEDKDKERINVGYMSADFCDHPVGRFIKPIIKEHDRKRVKVIGIDCGSRKDANNREIKEMCNGWIDVNNLSDQEAARKIANHGIDVLIELGGYTAENRLGILIEKPGKIQLSYLGYFAPTYLKSIDGWIGDDILFESLNKTQRDVHKLYKIRDGYMAMELKTEAVIKNTPLNRKFRFGCFNHSRKLTYETIRLFAKVMKENPESEIALKSISFSETEEQERIINLLNKNGISKKRVILMPYITDKIKHQEKYNEIDVALDPIPYGGATTTCEALEMGVPVITLKGEGMVGRLSSSILKYGRCEEWIGNNETEYINISVKLRKEGKRDEKKRIQLKAKLSKTDLTNQKRLSKQLEEAYLEALTIFEKANSI
ncbi:TPR repeat [Synechococcus sp. CC9902]|uniref:O-linked N-acetylglucosamine transferase, SPINDLY family protein n=1 Tax=Synechococcus sp. (strain CC9902) TaxID=316279 RepID=UPI00005D3D0B|nr:hypothetical protein [Synechococcus sp. CC9902]ABB25089.1 TPR repeat [Synechococcus sp. CC9902]